LQLRVSCRRCICPNPFRTQQAVRHQSCIYPTRAEILHQEMAQESVIQFQGNPSLQGREVPARFHTEAIKHSNTLWALHWIAKASRVSLFVRILIRPSFLSFPFRKCAVQVHALISAHACCLTLYFMTMMHANMLPAVWHTRYIPGHMFHA
jgi:hypothetical protein